MNRVVNISVHTTTYKTFSTITEPKCYKIILEGTKQNAIIIKESVLLGCDVRPFMIESVRS